MRATRRFCHDTTGSETDYRRAADALAGTGCDVTMAEYTADDLIDDCRHDLLVLARHLYRHGRRGR